MFKELIVKSYKGKYFANFYENINSMFSDINLKVSYINRQKCLKPFEKTFHYFSVKKNYWL